MRPEYNGEWRKAAEDLGFEIYAPFKLALDNGSTIEARVLVRWFGAKNGMLIVDEYDSIAKNKNEVIKAGYGFSVMKESSDNYNPDDFVEVLNDWGYTGPLSLRPIWIID